MKCTIISIIGLCLALGLNAAKPERTAVPLADPYVFYENGTYYLYGTHAPDGIAVMTSKNLQDWTSPDGSTTFLALHKDNSYGEKMFWAPEVYKINGKYIMFYSCEEHICMAEGDSPLGPFKNDGKPIVEEPGIDNSLFIDDDGTPYLFWVRFDKGNVIWMAQMTPDLKHIMPETMSFVLKAEEPWECDDSFITEGPFCVKHNGTYYLTYSANHFRSLKYGVGVATTNDLKKPWTKYENNPVLQNVGNLYGTGHHSFFTDKQGNLRIVFHSHFSDVKIAPRLTHISSWKFVKQPQGIDTIEISPEYITLYVK